MGAIETAVKWYLSRPDKYSMDVIMERTRYRFGKVNQWQVRKEIAAQLAQRAYAVRASTFRDNLNLAVIKPPSKTGNREMIRVNVNMGFDDPGRKKGSRLSDKGFTYDFPKTGTWGELRAKIREKLIAWIKEHYTVEGASRRVKRFSINQVEAL